MIKELYHQDIVAFWYLIVLFLIEITLSAFRENQFTLWMSILIVCILLVYIQYEKTLTFAWQFTLVLVCISAPVVITYVLPTKQDDIPTSITTAPSIVAPCATAPDNTYGFCWIKNNTACCSQETTSPSLPPNYKCDTSGSIAGKIRSDRKCQKI